MRSDRIRWLWATSLFGSIPKLVGDRALILPINASQGEWFPEMMEDGSADKSTVASVVLGLISGFAITPLLPTTSLLAQEVESNQFFVNCSECLVLCRTNALLDLNEKFAVLPEESVLIR